VFSRFPLIYLTTLPNTINEIIFKSKNIKKRNEIKKTSQNIESAPGTQIKVMEMDKVCYK